MFEKFGDETRHAIGNMYHEARRLNNNQATSVHLLLALMSDSASELTQLLGMFGLNRDTIAFWSVEEMGFTVGSLPPSIRMSAEAHKVLDRTQRDAAERGITTITPGMLILAMLDEPDCMVKRLLVTLGIGQRALRGRIERQFTV